MSLVLVTHALYGYLLSSRSIICTIKLPFIILQLFCKVLRHSIVTVSRSHSYLSLRATYTVGSMAGLGFSMAVVGLSIGIFVGFILWKGRLGLPYYYCSTRLEACFIITILRCAHIIFLMNFSGPRSCGALWLTLLTSLTPPWSPWRPLPTLVPPPWPPSPSLRGTEQRTRLCQT